MKLCVFGSRSIKGATGRVFVRYGIASALVTWGIEAETITEFVVGEATGVDKLAKKLARKADIPVTPFPAAWEDLTATPCKVKTRPDGSQYNVLAGFNRNETMAVYADRFVGIWDGESGGTEDMIARINRLEKPVFVYMVPVL